MNDVLFDQMSQLSLSPSRSRMRMTPTPWTRLQMPTTEWCDLKVVETPNLNVLNMMLDMNRDDPSVRSSLTRMQNYENMMRSNGGSMEVVYRQNDYSEDSDGGYMGAKKIGRSYTNSALQRFPSKIINTMYKRTNVEVDIKSSYSSMLSQAFRHLDLPALESYVDDSDGIYRGFHRTLGMDKHKVKKMVNSIICSFPDTPGDYGIGFGDIDLLRSISEHPFVTGFKADLHKMASDLERTYPGFYDVCKKHGDRNGNSKVAGLAFSYLASDMEHSVMRTIISNYYQEGPIENLVWRFDGILIPESKIIGRSWEQECSMLSNLVLDKLGIRVSFKIKSLQENSLGISIPTEELQDVSGYNRWKREHENIWCRIKNPPGYLMKLSGRNNYVHINDVGFKHNTMEQSPDFIKQWKADPTKRSFEAKTFMPPPMICPSNMFNTYGGIEASFLPENAHPVSLDIYMKHVDNLVGNLHQNHPENVEYFHNWIAHLIQKPGEKTRTMIHIRSTPGVGKDLFAIILEKVIGEPLVHRTGILSQVMGKSSVHQEGKILMVISELSYTDSAPHMETFKDHITSARLSVNAKYISEYSTVSCTNWLTFSNNFGAMPVSVDDRRMVVFTANGAHSNKSEYFDPLIEFMNDISNIRAIYDFYMQRDISGFNPVEDRPITEGHKQMAQGSSMNPVIPFLKKAIPVWKSNAVAFASRDYTLLDGEILRISSSILMGDFQIYVQENAFKNLDSKHKVVCFGYKCLQEFNAQSEKFVSEHVTTLFENTKSHGNRFWKIDLPGFQRFIEHTFSDIMGDDDDDDSGYAHGFHP